MFFFSLMVALDIVDRGIGIALVSRYPQSSVISLLGSYWASLKVYFLFYELKYDRLGSSGCAYLKH
jgi:hypothetical protein